MVESASTAGVNKAQLVGTQDGREIVPVYNRSSFLVQYVNKLSNILKYYLLHFSKCDPGEIYFKEYK